MTEPSPEELAAIRNENDFDAEPPKIVPIARPRLQSTTYLPDIHRMLPASPDAEMGVLGSFLLAPREVGGICAENAINGRTFHIPAHGEIFDVLMDMWGANLPIDFITLTKALCTAGRIDQVGGAAFVTSLFTFLPTAANVAYYIDILLEKHTLREIIKVCTDYAARSYDEHNDVQLLLEGVESAVFAITQDRFKGKSRSAKELVMNAVTAIQDLYERRGAITGLSTGIGELDKLTDGLQRKEMLVIAARPSHGKTALAMQIAEHIAVDLRKPVAVFSLEMSAEQLMQRTLCSRARVNLQRVRDGFLSERDFPALTVAASKLAEAPMYFEEGSDMTIQELRAKARRLKSAHGIEAIFIDSLSVLKSTAKDRWREVAEVSNGCKEMAKELDLPVVVVAHLHRRADTNERPRVSDLRESGNIEQDADSIWMLVREELMADSDDAAEELRGRATLRIGKQRMGEMNVPIPLTFLKEFSRFEMRAVSDDEPVTVKSSKKVFRQHPKSSKRRQEEAPSDGLFED